ncbi:MBL fold metallo-hydrolase [Phycicoccus endophyticus]|uniref:MBL fold metallo-hydrolase n=1 Tax=Phycicoccus endophyticus TaxID=1690220 RepID=A0A7G9QZR1_9MICO|nr:MBL fold metallo-hydrolase [Phycicoccus endophyticus]NHI20031.1 MBL fold metallo-hydrolase [Phycicoccus endophyticus]QNN48836.1 MBL fold metallo-hydrolase [Phycicoccus endophyticus]GGL42436.1 MBL fold metallo-hydrolase [Phycicoccus endophyticus]
MTTTVYVLGSGTPEPTPERFGSAFAVDVDGEVLMVDCGPAATWKLVKAGLAPTQVGTLFFTHHHFDHDVDYPCFLLTRWDQGAGLVEPLHAIGPAPTSLLTERLVGPDGAFFADIHARVNWSGSQGIWAHRGGTLPRTPPRVRTTDIEAGHEHRGDSWSMRSALAIHAQPWLDSLSYRLETSDGSIVFTGDTEPCDSVRELARGADIMFSMCWNTNAAHTRYREGLCTLEGAVSMASDAGVGTLVLVHTGANVSNPQTVDAALLGMGDTYGGRVVLADELMHLTLSRGQLSVGPTAGLLRP